MRYTLLTAVLLGGLEFALVNGIGIAQQGQRTDNDTDVQVQVGERQEEQRQARQQQQQQRQRTQRQAVSSNLRTARASQLDGMTVVNAQGQELGQIEDVVLDLQSGKIRYAALSFGGFLGLGDKLFAIPWESFELKQSAQEDEEQLVLNVDKQTLENAPGFDQDQWPNFADRSWTDRVDQHYTAQRQQRQQQDQQEQDPQQRQQRDSDFDIDIE